MATSQCIKWGLVDGGCDVRGDSLEVGVRFIVHTVLGCNVMKAVVYTPRDAGVDLSITRYIEVYGVNVRLWYRFSTTWES